ncbi:MAG: pyridoxal phosphate-dependent aminotransferase [Deltaproteobacteria bacterium]|nr:pyridoxal phosphate-dependent aminotransferase [Deltaproteobacteria bacterium]
MPSILSERIPYSEIRKMLDAATALEKQGRKVVHMEIGRTDFDTPQNIKDAAIKALNDGKVHYCPNAGIMELREAVCEKYASEYNLTYSPATDVVVTNGVAEAIYIAISALLNPGDQVLIPDPAWLNYGIVPLTHLIEPVPYSLLLENDFQPDIDELESLITPRTKMIALVSPSNPGGVCIKPEYLEKIAALAVKHDLIVLSDEIYEKIVYAPTRHVSIATYPGMRERTLVLNGMSKFYSMTGWRIGYVIGDKKYMNPILRLHQYLLTSCNTFAQYGAVEALRGSQEEPRKMLEEFTRRRDFLCTAMKAVPGVRFVEPDGAFYLFLDVRALGLTGYEAAQDLLEKAGVVTVAGESFGKNGAGFIRLAYSTSLDDIKTACAAMRHYFATANGGR